MLFSRFWALLLALWSAAILGFDGFERADLPPVTVSDWGLKIVVFDVGQADAIMLLTPNGDTVLIDGGRSNAHGTKLASHLKDAAENGVASMETLDLLYVTHYDADHIGGLRKFVDEGISIRKAIDQGPSGKRKILTPAGNSTTYAKYLAAVGDPDGDGRQDPEEHKFVRIEGYAGQVERIGKQDEVVLTLVSAKGDTLGEDHDLDLDPEGVSTSFDENPGSLALTVTLGEFEFYTAGDQTDDDWKNKPPVEQKLVDAGAISDMDVLKVSHHGSDTSTSNDLVSAVSPEVSIISTKFSTNHRLPKAIAVKVLEDNRSYVLVTNDGLGGNARFADSSGTTVDDGYDHDQHAVFNMQGDITILVSEDGARYTVSSTDFNKTFSSVDSQNAR